MSSLPLEGIRILDLSMWWSGPLCTSYLGAQGAEVIKLESVQAPDGFRYTGAVPGENWWELGPQFNNANLNKLGLTLNLNDSEGINLFEELVKKCDVVIENFTPQVMGNFGLTYERLCELNPEIIMISMPAYGKEGPYSDQPGFAYTFEILSGIAQVNGYLDGNPTIISGVGDVISSFHACHALLAALEYKEETGEGQNVEVAQVEANMNLMGQPVADASMNGRNWGRTGNRHPNMAPHGIYRSKGEDDWVAISITNEDEWQRFCSATSNSALANDPRFQTMEDRIELQDELDELVESWTSQLGNHDASELLQQSGLNAGPVVDFKEMEEDPFLQGMFQKMNRKHTGTHAYQGWPVRISGERLEHNRPAPLLGEHNEYVLRDILKLTDDQISTLEQNNVIGEVPLGVL